MGLRISHETWIGSYIAFMAWRKRIAQVAGLPPLELMEGFYKPLETGMPTLWTSSPPDRILQELDKNLPIKWECLRHSSLNLLLSHSDCDGKISWKYCKKIADCLELLIDLLPVEEGEVGYSWNWIEKTEKFVKGLRLSYQNKEDLIFS